MVPVWPGGCTATGRSTVKSVEMWPCDVENDKTISLTF